MWELCDYRTSNAQYMKLCVKQITHEIYVNLDFLVLFAMACSLNDPIIAVHC